MNDLAGSGHVEKEGKMMMRRRGFAGTRKQMLYTASAKHRPARLSRAKPAAHIFQAGREDCRKIKRLCEGNSESIDKSGSRNLPAADDCFEGFGDYV